MKIRGEKAFSFCRSVFVVNEDGGVAVDIRLKKPVLPRFAFLELSACREIRSVKLSVEQRHH